MAFTFRISKPSDLESTLTKIKAKIISSGGSFQGDVNSGKIAANGVEGTYAIGFDDIAITITKNPYIFKGPVENFIRDEFRKSSV